MLTPEDIKNLTEYQKQVFVTKDEFSKGMEKLTTIQSSVDKIAKNFDTQDKKVIRLEHKSKEVDDFLIQAAPKLGLKYEL